MASAAEIEEIVTGVKRHPRPSRKELLKARREEMAALPLWKKPIAYVLRAIQLVGGVTIWLGILNLSLQGIAFGIALAVIAELLFQVLKGRPYVWETN